MNILHHKSWHVRNKKNIERVRNDEKKAREEEEAKERRKAIAESEVRINLLRSRTGRDRSSDLTKESLNLFLDTGVNASDQANREHEEEAKQEKEDWERKVGIFSYLGQGCGEPEVERPWYLLDHSKRMKLDIEEDNKKLDKKNDCTNAKSEPLCDMRRYLDVMKKGSHNKPKNASLPTNQQVYYYLTVSLFSFES